MNDETFALLVERYLEGSLNDGERAELRAAVAANAARARAFGHQVRQHMRLHAQTTRWDFTESQRIALLVLGEADQTQTPPPAPFLVEPTWRDNLRALFRGLRARHDTGAYRYARHLLLRWFAPGTAAAVLSVAIALLVLLYVIPDRPEPPQPPTITRLPPPAPLPTLDFLFPPPEPDIRIPDGPDAAMPGVPFAPDGPAGPDLSPAAPDGPAALAPTPVWLPPTAPSYALLPLPPSLRGRTPEARDELARQFRVDPRVDGYVVRTLQWLKAHQQADGSWEGQERVAMTGLALLTLLAHGETGASREYGDAVRRAIAFLTVAQDERGAFSGNAYAHGIATYAIAEAAALTRVMALKELLEKAVQVILDGQQTEGGFDYSYARNARYDTSVTGWQVQALKAAQTAGASNPGLADGLERAVRFLKTRSFALDGSGFVYAGTGGVQPASGATPTMTAVGTLCLQLLEEGRSAQARAGTRALAEYTFRWASGADGRTALYGLYYATQVKLQESPAAWEKWNPRCMAELMAAQKTDGHWEGGDHDSGSHVYTTTMAALALQVYCRILPTYARVEGRPEVAAVPSSNEVPVQVR
jgi:hypothetical protein